jgi:hypothetical protein
MKLSNLEAWFAKIFTFAIIFKQPVVFTVLTVSVVAIYMNFYYKGKAEKINQK